MARRGTWVQRWRVPLGFACGALFLIFGKPKPLTLLMGAFVALPGLALRAWATGYLRKNDELATAGPYAFTRNPLYLGSFLMGIGFTIAAGQWILAVLFAILFLGIYVPVMRVESATLAELFGEGYRHYQQAVPTFFPRILPYRDPARSEVRFDTALYYRYREYRAALGSVLAWTLLALKAYFLR